MLEGRDVSFWDGVLPPDWFAQWDFVILRAFNEYGVPDTVFAANWSNAKGRTRRGAYGWPRAGGDNVALARALATAAPDAELGWWADYETSGAGLASPAELETYLRTLEAIVPGRRGFYSNLSELPRSAYLDTVPWWFANPSNNPEPRPVTITQYGIVDGHDANRADTGALDIFTGKEPEDMAKDNLYIAAHRDPASIWLYNGIEKRHVTPPEWDFTVRLAALVGAPAPAPLVIDDTWFDSIAIAGAATVDVASLTALLVPALIAAGVTGITKADVHDALVSVLHSTS